MMGFHERSGVFYGKQENGGYLTTNCRRSSHGGEASAPGEDAHLVHDSRILENRVNSVAFATLEKEMGYERASPDKTLAEIIRYDFLKNQRELRSKHASDSTLPLIEKQGFIGFEGSV